jgi:hypothetical protein
LLALRSLLRGAASRDAHATPLVNPYKIENLREVNATFTTKTPFKNVADRVSCVEGVSTGSPPPPIRPDLWRSPLAAPYPPRRDASGGGGATSCASQPSLPPSPTEPPDQPAPAPHRPQPPRPRPPRHRRGPSSAELRRAARVFAHRSRAEQGLPPYITDPEVIAKLVVLFRPSADQDRDDHHDGDGGRR